jgi:patatin-like phospholipase/acyl hydrolase
MKMRGYLIMKVLSSAIVSADESSDEKPFNILSLEGQLYKGYLTAGMIDFIEKKAYLDALRDSCIQPRQIQRIAISELFDMIAGSETGAIIAASLALKNNDEATNST